MTHFPGQCRSWTTSTRLAAGHLCEFCDLLCETTRPETRSRYKRQF